MTFTSQQISMLSKIIEDKGFKFDEYINETDSNSFPDWKIDQMCNWVNDEFLRYGISMNNEPNECGLKLEDLLDAINKKRIAI